MRRSIIAGIATAAILIAAPTFAAAQTLRGAVTDAGGRPMAGVVVALLDPSAREVARVLSTERGEYRLMAPAAGRAVSGASRSRPISDSAASISVSIPDSTLSKRPATARTTVHES